MTQLHDICLISLYTSIFTFFTHKKFLFYVHCIFVDSAFNEMQWAAFSLKLFYELMIVCVLFLQNCFLQTDNHGRPFPVKCFVSAPFVSRHHFEIRRIGEAPPPDDPTAWSEVYWSVFDPGSASGTFINGQRIPKLKEIRKFAASRP